MKKYTIYRNDKLYILHVWRRYFVIYDNVYNKIYQKTCKNPIVDVLNYGFSFSRSTRIHNCGSDVVVEATTFSSEEIHGGNSETDDLHGNRPSEEQKFNDGLGGGSGTGLTPSTSSNAGENADGNNNPSASATGNQSSGKKAGENKKSPAHGARNTKKAGTSVFSRREKAKMKNKGLLSTGAIHKKEDLTSEQKSLVKSVARIIEKWCGQSNISSTREMLDVFDFYKRKILGENIEPALHREKRRGSKIKLLLTNDVSGSCATHSGICEAIAKAITSQEEVDVSYTENVNGWRMASNDEALDGVPIDYKDYDLVIYFGDNDILHMLDKYDKNKFIVLSNEHHNNRGPKIRNKRPLYIDGVDLRSVQSIYEAIKMLDRIIK